MNIGDYVRTNYGICKVKNIENFNDSKIISFDRFSGFMTKFNDSPEGTLFNELVINKESDLDEINFSSNIIDLIEVGDYVNKNKIVHIQEESPDYPKRLLFAGVDENNIDDVWEVYNKDDIKSIVTKEQFESMEYKIGE